MHYIGGGGVVTYRKTQIALNWRLALAIISLGLVIIGLGFAPYLASQYRDIDYRVYFTSMIGSSLVLVTMLYWLAHSGRWVKSAFVAFSVLSVFFVQSRLVSGLAIGFALILVVLKSRWMFLVSVAALVTLNTYFTLVQHRLYADAPLGQHWMLSQIVSQAPQPSDGTMIVVLDESAERLGLVRFENRRDILHNAIQYIYENPTLIGSFCIRGAEQFGFFSESCEFAEDGYHYSWAQGNVIVPYEQLLVFAYDDVEGLRLLQSLPEGGSRYQPLNVAGTGAATPNRAYSLLAGFPTSRPEAMINWARLH